MIRWNKALKGVKRWLNISSSLDIEPHTVQTFRVIEHACPRCAEPNTWGDVCGSCLISEPPAYHRVLSVYEYEGALKQLLLQFKYGGDLAVGRSLGRLMAHHFQRKERAIQALIPIPLHRDRLLDRGFNQSLELANCLSKQLDVPVLARVLVRKKATDHQTGLSRIARLKNVHQAFECQTSLPTHINHVALIDDVFTTGATMQAAAKTIKAQHPDVHIDVWSLAKALE